MLSVNRWWTAVMFAGMIILTCGFTAPPAEPQVEGPRQRTFRVEGGLKHESRGRSSPSGTTSVADSTVIEYTAADSLAADSLGVTLTELGRYRSLQKQDSLAVTGADTLAAAEPEPEVLSKRARRRLELDRRLADTSFVRHNWLFRDSIPISRLTAYSFVVPGLSQLYNDQAWKVPVLYGTVGLSSYFWFSEQKKYKRLRNEYEYMYARPLEYGRDDIDPVQRKMIQQNTVRQIFMFAAIGSYIYFIGDGAVNYPGSLTNVKKATTLSTIFPGAGQIYNKSYWKAPIVMGAFASMAFLIDWNNRGYQMFKQAYAWKADDVGDDDNGTSHPRYGHLPLESLKNYKNSYRRNRDLCIILTGVVYLVNIIEAHVDAHMKTYDVSDDLSMNVYPYMDNIRIRSNVGTSNIYGLSLQLTF